MRLGYYCWLLWLFGTTSQVQCDEWSVAISGPGPSWYNDLALDKAGNIVALGFFWSSDLSTFQFYNKSMVQASTLLRPEQSLLGLQNFVQVFTPQGELLSTVYFIAQSCTSAAGKLAIDSRSNRIISCPFVTDARFFLDDARTSLTRISGSNRLSCFMVKMDRFNQVSWKIRVFSTNNDGNIDRCIVSVDTRDDSIYLLATVTANTPVTMISSDGTGVNFQGHATGSSLLVKYSENGFVQWFKTLTSSRLRESNLLHVDQLGNLIWAGAFENETVLYSHSGSQNTVTPVTSFNSSGGTDGFILKLSDKGDLVWSSIVCGDNDEEIMSVTADSENNIAVAGIFRSNTTVFRYLNNTQTSIVSRIFFADTPQYTYLGGFVTKISPNGSMLWITNQTLGVPTSFLYLQNILLSFNQYNTLSVSMQSTQFHRCDDTSGSSLILPRRAATDSYIVEYDKNGNFISNISFISTNQDHIQRAMYNSYGEMVYGGASISSTFQLSPKYEWTFSNGRYNSFILFTNNQVAYVDFFRRNLNWICFARVSQSLIDIHSNEVPKLTNAFPTRLLGNDSKLVVIGCSVSVCFVSVDGTQLDGFSRHPFYVAFSETDIEQVNNSTECRSLQHELGLLSVVGTLEDGTFAFEMEEQYGYVTNLPLNEVEDRSNVTLSFRMAFLEDSFIIGCDTTTDSINVVFNATGTIRVSVALNDIVIQTQSITQERFSIVLQSSQLTLLNGNNTLWNIVLVNGSLSRLTVTSRGKSIVESMFLNVRPSSDSSSDTSSLIEPTTTYENPTYITETMTETNSNDNAGPKNEFSIFGLTGIVLYVSIGGTAFVLVSLISTSIYFVRKRMSKKKSYDYEGVTTNVTASTITRPRRDERTLVNNNTLVDF